MSKATVIQTEVSGVAVRPWNYVSVCSGIGGLDLGIRLAMPESCCVLYAEREIASAESLVARIEDGQLDPAPVWADLRSLDGAAWRGRVDCLAGGIPCQGYSLAGKRLLHDDERSLWGEFRRLLREMEPAYCFVENVPGFAVPDRGRKLTAPIVRVLGELAEDGWDAEWLSVSAEDLGASQRRERVFLLGRRRGAVADAKGPGGRLLTRSQYGEKGESQREAQGRTLRRGNGCSVDEQPEQCCGSVRSGDDVANADRSGCVREELHLPERGSRQPVPDVAGAGATVEYADCSRRSSAGSGHPLDSWREPEPGRGDVGNAARKGLQGSNHSLCGQGTPHQPRGSSDAGSGLAAACLPLWPPGPGLGGHGVVDDIIKLLRKDPVGAWRKYQAELANTLRWVRILEVRPDLAPSLTEEEAQSCFRHLADGFPGWMAASRVDQLRALGNACTSLQAAVAFRVLWSRIHNLK